MEAGVFLVVICWMYTAYTVRERRGIWADLGREVPNVLEVGAGSVQASGDPSTRNYGERAAVRCWRGKGENRDNGKWEEEAGECSFIVRQVGWVVR